jgi:hypothetical protein
MFCSLTYALGNIELFFCLYAVDWNNPTQCNSSHSRLLGFFTALPGIWRALQCLRRYADTRSLFPHMANFGKYMCTILYYMSLSLWRHNKNHKLRILFIFWATINAVYCSVWDIVMDWSLMDPYAKHPFLRNTLGFKYAWWYYAAIVIDPVLRFNWIFYAIYGHDVQHSTKVAFLVALSEVLRRGMWQLFRVENEHCTKYVAQESQDYDLHANTFTASVVTAHHEMCPCRTKSVSKRKAKQNQRKKKKADTRRTSKRNDLAALHLHLRQRPEWIQHVERPTPSSH